MKQSRKESPVLNEMMDKKTYVRVMYWNQDHTKLLEYAGYVMNYDDQYLRLREVSRERNGELVLRDRIENIAIGVGY